jgi:hypothetical protein
LTGNVVVVDLVSDDEDVEIQNPALDDVPMSAPNVTLDDALAEVLQVLPDIDPKVAPLLVLADYSMLRNDLEDWLKVLIRSAYSCLKFWKSRTRELVESDPPRSLNWTPKLQKQIIQRQIVVSPTFSITKELRNSLSQIL